MKMKMEEKDQLLGTERHRSAEHLDSPLPGA